MVKHPCVGCVYFDACGVTTRTEPCAGRQTRGRKRYPGIEEAERERICSSRRNAPVEEPDFIGGAPNYDKFAGVSPGEVLALLNID